MLNYTKKTLKHFYQPHRFGKIKNPSGVGEVGNLMCGDIMRLYLKIKKNKKGEEIIKDIKFETFGCIAAIATSSILTDLAINRPIKEALKIKAQDIIQNLGGLPKIKYHCSLLADDALSEAIYDYFKKNHQPVPSALEKRHQLMQKSKEKLAQKFKISFST